MDSENMVYRADWALIDGKLVEDAHFVLERGCIAALGDATVTTDGPVHDLGRAVVLPGMVNAHSHGFQRGIRGLTHRRGQGDPSSFWSWREAMYRQASQLDPSQLYALTRLAYQEMAGAGITCVGEFHYLHHDPQGQPYADPDELSLQVAAAAEDVGIRLVLLEVYYAQSAPQQPPLPEQRRFCDGSVDAYLTRVDRLRSRGLAVGLAPHSIRAVPLDHLRVLAEYARRHGLPIHAHVSEQTEENRIAHQALGMTPTAAFAEAGCLDAGMNFTAVHGIHLEPDDFAALSRHHVCACPTTEADLGDGILPAGELFRRGTTLALGSDSNAVIDLVQEARALEMHERLRTRSRLCLADDWGQVAPTLLAAATTGGARALGRSDLGRLRVGQPFDACTVELDHPLLQRVSAEHALDALLLSGTAAPIGKVFVGGRRLQ